MLAGNTSAPMACPSSRSQIASLVLRFVVAAAASTALWFGSSDAADAGAHAATPAAHASVSR